MRTICAYGPQSGRLNTQKVRFCNELASEWDLGSFSEIIVSVGNFRGHVGKCADGFEGVHGGNGIGVRNAVGGRLLKFCDKKESCAWQILGFIRQTKGKSLSVGGSETETDFELVKEKYKKYARDVKVIPWQLQHRLVVVDLDKKILKRIVRNKS